MYLSCLFQKSSTDLFFFNDTATTEIYTLSLHDALPILIKPRLYADDNREVVELALYVLGETLALCHPIIPYVTEEIWSLLDRKSTRLNSSHANISYAVFCLKKNLSQPRHETPRYR